MTSQPVLLALAVLGAMCLIAARLPPVLSPVTTWLSHRAVAPILGVVTGAFYWWMWGSLNALPLVHDEVAYLLQAEIFARGRWALPAPPLPEFFEQVHVLVTPLVAPKYPPGHALVLVPGVLAGLPGLMPILLSGTTGAMVFLLARKLTNGWVGLATWFLWLLAPTNLVYRPTYFSETTTGLLILLAWWALLRWRATGSAAAFSLLCAAIAWGAVTRPLTMLALSLPIGVAVAWNLRRRFQWRPLAPGIGMAALILTLYPIHNANVTGDWRHTPYRLYSDIYFPFDIPGFGARATPAQRPLPPDMQQLSAYSHDLHASHTVTALPAILLERSRTFLRHTWGYWHGFLALLAVIGLTALGPPGAFAVASAVMLLLAYAVFAHPPAWTLYYLEAVPVVAFVTALGLWRVTGWGLRATNRPKDPSSSSTTAAAGLVLLVLLLLGAPRMWASVARIRQAKFQDRAPKEAFVRRVAALEAPALVFVRYGPSHNTHFSLIANRAHPEDAAAWVAYDRGAENSALMRRVPDRTAYLFDEESGELRPMDPPTGTTRSSD